MLVAFLLYLVAAAAFAADRLPPRDFRGVRWGSYPPEDKGLKHIGLGMAKNRSASLEPFGGIAVKDETYFFNQRSLRFAAGTLVFDGDQYSQVKAYLVSQYGKPDF